MQLRRMAVHSILLTSYIICTGSAALVSMRVMKAVQVSEVMILGVVIAAAV
jgi:hypothetical protein